MTRFGRLSCCLLSLGVLAIGLTFGTSSVAGATDDCFKTAISGNTYNETEQPLKLISAAHGITNTWCQAPKGEVPAHDWNHWKAGDNFFLTEVHLVYQLPDNSTVSFNAAQNFFTGQTDTSCTVTGATQLYGCKAEVIDRVDPHKPVVKFRVHPR